MRAYGRAYGRGRSRRTSCHRARHFHPVFTMAWEKEPPRSSFIGKTAFFLQFLGLQPVNCFTLGETYKCLLKMSRNRLYCQGCCICATVDQAGAPDTRYPTRLEAAWSPFPHRRYRPASASKERDAGPALGFQLRCRFEPDCRPLRRLHPTVSATDSRFPNAYGSPEATPWRRGEDC